MMQSIKHELTLSPEQMEEEILSLRNENSTLKAQVTALIEVNHISILHVLAISVCMELLTLATSEQRRRTENREKQRNVQEE